MNRSPYRCILIDDEPPATQRLTELLSKYPSVFDIIARASNGKEAVTLIKDLDPDLIFLDIQMPGMTGFEMLQKLNRIPMIIFVTAFDQYSLQAFETNGIDYLLKPVKQERLEQTISKLELFKKDFNPKKLLGFLEEFSHGSGKKTMNSITIKLGSRMIFIKLDDVAYFKAGDKYVSLFTRTGEEHITEKTLKQLEEDLPGNFLRIHRSYIINTNQVKEVQKSFNSKYSVFLDNRHKSKITTGRSYHEQVKNWLD